ncbi:hypothetical protein EDD85DRAFT_950967 [Armillaria nabsnona]|nr:hypothetical protein EDD85DRAFT_950967 [Armillaria nabsnona]
MSTYPFQVLRVSIDSLSNQYNKLVPPTKKRQMKTDSVNDNYAQWIPGSDKYEVLEDYLEYDVMLGTSFIDPSGEENSMGSKRKGYDSSDNLMKVWRQLEGDFLEETIRQAGLGNGSHKPSCCQCLK